MSAEDGRGAAMVMLRERYGINPAKVLGDLGTPTAQAFHAEDRRDADRQLFALVCRPDLPSRANVMRALKGVQGPGMMQMVEWGPAFWPPAQVSCMIVIYERPFGGRVMTSLTAEFRRSDEYELSKRVIQPLAVALKELGSRGITHRAIRPTNLFYMDPGRQQIVLGDCVSAPPAFDQPRVCETIECAMAHHAGRGGGSYADDLYALGVALIMMWLGRNPVAQLDDDTVLRYKIAQGSYATLVGEERLPLPLVEVLRGLLCDDAEERWTIETLDLWLQGRRLSPIQPRLEKRSQRTFSFNGREHATARELAHAFTQSWEAAMPVVAGGSVELWLRRALDDKDKANSVATAARNAASSLGEKRVASDIMLAKSCMVLDPNAPIRYKGFSAMPDGFGAALALMMAENGDVRLFADLLLRDVPHLWFETREKYTAENSILDSLYRDLRGYLQHPSYANGIERCLYELNDGLPCRSPLIADQFVTELRELLPALDHAAKRVDGKVLPIDRHIVAFVAAKASFDTDKPVALLDSPEPERNTLGVLNFLAMIQYRLGPESLFNLASWVGGLMGPVIADYHNRDRRRAMEREIPRIVRQGSLVELFRLLDDPDERQRDRDGFAWARAEHAAADAEIRELEAGRVARDEAALRLGQQTAGLASSLIALLTVSILVIAQGW